MEKKLTRIISTDHLTQRKTSKQKAKPPKIWSPIQIVASYCPSSFPAKLGENLRRKVLAVERWRQDLTWMEHIDPMHIGRDPIWTSAFLAANERLVSEWRYFQLQNSTNSEGAFLFVMAPVSVCIIMIIILWPHKSGHAKEIDWHFTHINLGWTVDYWHVKGTILFFLHNLKK